MRSVSFLSQQTVFCDTRRHCTGLACRFLNRSNPTTPVSIVPRRIRIRSEQLSNASATLVDIIRHVSSSGSPYACVLRRDSFTHSSSGRVRYQDRSHDNHAVRRLPLTTSRASPACPASVLCRASLSHPLQSVSLRKYHSIDLQITSVCGRLRRPFERQRKSAPIGHFPPMLGHP